MTTDTKTANKTETKTDSRADVVVLYCNHRGEVRERHIRPVRWWFGTTTYYPRPGWVCTALDLERKTDDGYVTRDFSLDAFIAIGRQQIDQYLGMRDALVVSAGG